MVAIFKGSNAGVSVCNTPWGSTQHAKQIAPGITRVETASHGGFVLSEERMREFNARVTIHFQTFAGYGYFEEDCDWAAVALAFPEYFTDEDIRAAVSTVRHFGDPATCPSIPSIAQRWAPLVSWLDSHRGRDLIVHAFDLTRPYPWEE